MTVAGIPVHQCEPRTEMARAYVAVFNQGHPQLTLSDSYVAIAIRFCPFCGVQLERQHFTS